MYEVHLREFGFTYSTCGSFAILKERIQTQEIKKTKTKKKQEIGYSRYIYQHAKQKNHS